MKLSTSYPTDHLPLPYRCLTVTLSTTYRPLTVRCRLFAISVDNVNGFFIQAKEEMAWKIAKMMIEDVKSEQSRISTNRN